MKMSEGEFQKRVADALRSCLKNVPFLEIRGAAGETSENDVRPTSWSNWSFPAMSKA